MTRDQDTTPVDSVDWDRVELLSQLERAAKRGQGTRLSPQSIPVVLAALTDTGEEPSEAWQPIETAILWDVAVVTDGENVALAQLAWGDGGGTYWAIDSEDGLDWEPTHWSAPLAMRTAGKGTPTPDYCGIVEVNPEDFMTDELAILKRRRSAWVKEKGEFRASAPSIIAQLDAEIAALEALAQPTPDPTKEGE